MNQKEIGDNRIQEPKGKGEGNESDKKKLSIRLDLELIEKGLMDEQSVHLSKSSRSDSDTFMSFTLVNDIDPSQNPDSFRGQMTILDQSQHSAASFSSKKSSPKDKPNSKQTHLKPQPIIRHSSLNETLSLKLYGEPKRNPLTTTGLSSLNKRFSFGNAQTSSLAPSNNQKDNESTPESNEMPHPPSIEGDNLSSFLTTNQSTPARPESNENPVSYTSKRPKREKDHRQNTQNPNKSSSRIEKPKKPSLVILSQAKITETPQNKSFRSREALTQSIHSTSIVNFQGSFVGSGSKTTKEESKRPGVVLASSFLRPVSKNSGFEDPKWKNQGQEAKSRPVQKDKRKMEDRKTMKETPEKIGISKEVVDLSEALEAKMAGNQSSKKAQKEFQMERYEREKKTGQKTPKKEELDKKLSETIKLNWKGATERNHGLKSSIKENEAQAKSILKRKKEPTNMGTQEINKQLKTPKKSQMKKSPTNEREKGESYLIKEKGKQHQSNQRPSPSFTSEKQRGNAQQNIMVFSFGSTSHQPKCKGSPLKVSEVSKLGFEDQKEPQKFQIDQKIAKKTQAETPLSKTPELLQKELKPRSGTSPGNRSRPKSKETTRSHIEGVLLSKRILNYPFN